MAKTIIGLNDAKAVKKFSAFLAVDVGRTSYFNRKFMGMGVDSHMPVQILPQLERDSGEQITYDLVMQLKMQPVEGDNTLEGKEEDLRFFTDQVYIDQARGGVNTGGAMTRKRTIHDLRKIARVRQSEWWARLFDELLFLYLGGGGRDATSGASEADNTDFIWPTAYAGFANNTFVAPDTNHRLFGGNATSKATVDTADKMDITLIERAVTRAYSMGGGTTGIPAISPMMIEGEDRFVIIMHPFQSHDLRNNTTTGQWLDIQKSLATAIGNKSPIFAGGLGYHRNTVLHEHRAVLKANDYGAGANVAAARAMFLGRQAGVVAFGSAGTGLRFDWHEEARDNGNQAVISTSSIFGIKKTNFSVDGTALDFGVIALDTAAADPG